MEDASHGSLNDEIKHRDLHDLYFEEDEIMNLFI
jgi:hypothetical protein